MLRLLEENEEISLCNSVYCFHTLFHG
jgi:ADP-sugar diphosphatase